VEWVNANGLLLNLKKTNYMLFSRQHVQQSPTVSINNVQINRVNEAKFLGVILEEKLTWSSHIKALKVKMARYVGIMYRIRSHIPLKVRVQIFHSFVQSHLNFCSLVWGFAARSHINSLFSQQKKGMRAVMPGHVNYFYKDGILPSSTKASFNNLSVLTVHGIIASNAVNFMNKIFNFPNQLPKNVLATIPENAPSRLTGTDHESCQTWSENYNTNIYRNSIFFKGPLLFIDSSLDNAFNPMSCQSITAFKAQCKRIILNQQAEGEIDDWTSNIFLIHKINGLRSSKREKKL